MKYDIKNIKLAKKGKLRIEWASNNMPVLNLIKQRFSRQKSLKGVKIAACLHVTTETGVLATTLKAAGAEVYVCASNPLSTQDDVAASLVKDYNIPVFAIKGEDTKTYYKHIRSALGINPDITMDDGADLVSTIHKSKTNNLPWAGTEETTTGVIRLKAMYRKGSLKYPIIAVNDAMTKHLFDNRYGTGQSTIDGILRATNKLLSGSNFVVCGYGFCGRGVAMRAKGMGAKVIICEVDSLRALEAKMDGYDVMPLINASKIGDIFVTTTGDISVISRKHFLKMRSGVIVANSGHFNVEIDIPALKKLSTGVRKIRDFLQEFTLKDKRKIYLLGDGRLINLTAAEGHPASVMDMSFANQALSVEHIKNYHKSIKTGVYPVPKEIDERIAKLKLKSLGVKIDNLTRQQSRYLSSWEMGT